MSRFAPALARLLMRKIREILRLKLVNHSRPQDVTEGYAADWTMEQLRDPAQCIADRIDSLTRDAIPAGATA